ncbi:MAG: type II secretion system protein [Acidobacteriota bacterium]
MLQSLLMKSINLAVPSREKGTAPASGPDRSARNGQKGFTLIETVITFSIIAVVTGGFVTAIMLMDRGTRYGIGKSQIANTARGAMEGVARRLRNEMVQFNTVAGTDMGVSFDLDDGGDPLIRDAMLIYVDQNHTGEMYTADEEGKPVFAGLDDDDADGKADVLGIGLRAQDDDGDGNQDFIDTDDDGNPDDLDGDGRQDKLWNLVSVRFDNIDDVTTASLWLGGTVLARNLFVKLVTPTDALVAEKIDTFQYEAKSAIALLSDGNADGVLTEVELGSVKTANGIIDQQEEVALIDSVNVTLHVVSRGVRGTLMVLEVNTQITPRAIELFRVNGIVGLTDATDATQID